MKIERTKNATRNIIYGIILKVYQILIPFIMRTLMIYFMGVKYLGLNSLFTSILQVLNLAELGVGSAMVFNMYKPIVDDDTKTICALLNLYKNYYRIIGAVIAGAGIILLPFVPKLINGSVPEDINIYILYLMNLALTVISYWLYAYKTSILQAFQRTDIISKITFLINTLQYILQIIIVIVAKNYYLFVIVALFSQALNNIVTAVVVNRIYPQYRAEGKLENNMITDINRCIKDLFTSKLGTVIINSADSIVISAFLGLSMLAIYQNYFFILNAIIGFVTIIFTSCTAGIGNSILTETLEKNFNDFKKFTFIISWIAGFCVTCLLCLYQPFMEIWVGKSLQLNFSVVICLCIYYYIYEINQLLNLYKDAAGMWHEDRYRPLFTALLNLFLNLVMVNIWGIYGVVLSTVISMIFLGMPWLLKNLFTVLFEKKYLMIYFKSLIYYMVIVFLGAVLTYVCCCFIKTNAILTVIIRLLICCVIPNFVYYLCYKNKKEFKDSIKIIDKITKGKLKKFY